MTDYQKFEEEKRKLWEKGLSGAEYEKAVQKLCRKYNL